MLSFNPIDYALSIFLEGGPETVRLHN